MEEPMQSEEVTSSAACPMESRLRRPQGRPSSYQTDTEGTKRRSLLPQPGQTRYTSQFSDAGAARLETNTEPTGLSRPRPKSMYQTGDSFPQTGRLEDKPARLRAIRPPNSISRPDDPQTAALDRARSLRRPNAPTQSLPTSKITSHARTQSSSNVPVTWREATGTKLTAERPKSLLTASSGSAKPKLVPTVAESIAPRASARLAGMSRTDSRKIRSDIPSGGVAPRPVTRPEDPVGGHLRRREIVRDEQTRTTRPAFTTLQQHFTPRKAGKAPTSTFLHPVPAPSVNSLPSEVVSLQSELLQLHLLHEKSAELSQRWEVSAKRNLHKSFEEVASLHQAMLDLECAGQEQKNLQALLAWTSGASSTKLMQYVQVLSGPLHELPALVEPGGRFQRLMDQFENWISRVEKNWSARLSSDHHESVEGLGDSWKAENTALTRKVIAFSRELEQISRPSSESSIACIVDTCTTMLKGLSDELSIMHAIEAEVAAKEKVWIAGRLQTIAGHVDSDLLVDSGAMAAWRT